MTTDMIKVDSWDAEAAINSMLPEFDTPKKQQFLFYRACYFNIVEAFQLAGINRSLFRDWMRKDEFFRDWYQNKLSEVQKFIGPKLVKVQFIRNMTLALQIDGQVLQKAAFADLGFEVLTEKEMDWLEKASNRYKAADLAAMVRALGEAESGVQQGDTQVNLTFVVPNSEVVTEEARRAGYRNLLETFTQKTEYIEGDFITQDDY